MASKRVLILDDDQAQESDQVVLIEVLDGQ